MIVLLPLFAATSSKHPGLISSLPMSLNDLPLELVNIIVDHFSDDVKALKTLALISRPFLSTCRTHLFTSLRLNTLHPSFSYKCVSWTKILQRSSEILPYIRVLELGPPVFRLRARDPKLSSEHWNGVHNSGLPSIHDDRVQAIMKGAVNAQNVTLRFEFQTWNRFSATFQQCVLDLVRRDSISTLSLEDAVALPLHKLRTCRRLRNLSLISISNPQEFHSDDDMEPDHNTRGHLESLTLYVSDECVEPLFGSPASPLDVSNLQRLAVNTTGSDGRKALEIIPSIAQSITILELRVDDGKGYDLCSLDNFPALSSLLISATYDRHARSLLTLASFFSKTQNPSKLDQLQILLRHDVPQLEHEKGSHDLMRLCAHNDWQTFDQSLLGRNMFPMLRVMKLVLRPKDVTTFINAHLISTLHLSLIKVMPRLYALTNPTIEVFDGKCGVLSWQKRQLKF
ncbi:unnamed protein product [Cyclocybe aegerita]|uniref:Uncharacterized protein n=1 Tax=Cyclocybe aegerita TaxID=1973307 RepID=A0A8S0WB63_CYCAE|nr:unnamed protein product [Cyclocybe aegerita]